MITFSIDITYLYPSSRRETKILTPSAGNLKWSGLVGVSRAPQDPTSLNFNECSVVKMVGKSVCIGFFSYRDYVSW